MTYPLIRRLLFALDAESAHELVADQIERLQQIPIFLGAMERMCRPASSLRRTVWGLAFDSPIGIAAGFDKNATMMAFLSAIGFGFLEIGTVTLRPQQGNPRPRLFRYPEARALINRMGFNSDGADAVAERLQRWRDTAPLQPPLLVNIGKNRDVPLERAAEAYAECYRRLAPLADLVTINVSSPNTPALRDLQRPEQLFQLLETIRSLRHDSQPLVVKIAPDVDAVQLGEICDVCTRLADGMICTNTTIDRVTGMGETAGGLSGKPLLEKSTMILHRVRQVVGESYPLIGVGGVFTVEDVRVKFAAGADLVQVYTGFVYEGPRLPARLARELAR